MRTLRPLEPNGLYHVTTRGVRQTPLFHDEHDWLRYLEFLDAAVTAFDWRCLSYCLMPNHVHLLLQTPEPNLPQGMQQLNLRYAMRFNWKYGFKGHAFDRRYGARLLGADDHLLTVVGYIASNPVRAGLVDAPAAWRWSSYRSLIGRTTAPRFLDVRAALELFGSRRRLREFVENPSEPALEETRLKTA
jgi:REP element-mobilizing transposase RayT